MRYLVTGANGFVGKALCSELNKRGLSIRAAVRSANSTITAAEVKVVGDMDDETDWTDALREVDVVIHLAARVHVMKDSAADPLAEYIKVNVLGTANLAYQAARAGVKRLVYVSTVKVNGEKTAGTKLFMESDAPSPQDPYAISKSQAEQALRRIEQETGLKVVVVRPPLIYGPGVKGNFINLLVAIDKGLPLPLAGAHNARSLLYVGNLVDALIACSTQPAAAGQTYLLSDGEDVSTASLAEKIAGSLGRTSRLFYFPTIILRAVAALLGRSAQVERLFGSLRVSDEKICTELGWSPPYTLEQGLRATADWYQNIGCRQ